MDKSYPQGDFFSMYVHVRPWLLKKESEEEEEWDEEEWEDEDFDEEDVDEEE